MKEWCSMIKIDWKRWLLGFHIHVNESIIATRKTLYVYILCLRLTFHGKRRGMNIVLGEIE